ncbi:MAG TPA: cytochrome c biogenesis protein CcdA [Bosea sp. (in: a-proteobacteria)]|uniref:cytochrome c biogenesis CcdA family protein n=1 Tax=Bosea sp. (in: a-proteobacteria) TaxID=1871050 RepID=UPI002E13D89A|nr:cytochrome c biogenesis protein CcdA [Bosea sp. (in: a-proteobacteria)]
MAGLLSFLSPCVLPLVPPYLCFLAGVGIGELSGASGRLEARQSRRIIMMAGAFVLGFTTVFVALGATASTIGAVVTAYFETLSIIAGALILIMGLHFLGWLRIPLLYREARFQTERKPASMVGAYLVGLAFAFGWTPCVGPVLATALMVAGAEGTAARGATLLAAYSLGIGVPFLLAAVFAGPFLNLMARFRRHMPVVEKTMGAALVVTGLLFMTGTMPVLAGWLLQTFPALGTIG